MKFPGPTQPRGRKLLEVPGYTFHVLVTTLSHDPVQTWRFYNSRAEIENRIFARTTLRYGDVYFFARASNSRRSSGDSSITYGSSSASTTSTEVEG